MITRRELLIDAAALASTICLPRSVFAQNFWDSPRSLWLVRHETGEQVNAVYWYDGQLAPGFVNICELLRDVRADKAVQMHVTLLDILYTVQGWLAGNGVSRPIMVNSGYRTPSTNNRLLSEGAVRNSMHLYGRAADVWIPGVPADYLARLGLYLKGGGVGFYPSRGFVHLDTGRVRVWRG